MSRFKTAFSDIAQFYNGLPDKILKEVDIEHHLWQRRTAWNLPKTMSSQRFIRMLVMTARMTEIDFAFPPPYRRQVRYVWGNVPIYEVMQTIKPHSYFSHHSAVKFHGLTEQRPEITYLTIEQRNSSISRGQMVQSTIDRAFQGKPRISAHVAKSKDFEIRVVAGRNTSRLGVVEMSIVPGARPLPLTNLERTLIDITVRPIYAGGVVEVAKAFGSAKGKLSVVALSAMLEKLGYTYPYHQAIGFYLERTGYDTSLLDPLRKLPMDFDFYLAHNMQQTEYNKDWRLFVPRNF